MKLYQGPVLCLLQDEFREGRSKSVVVPKTESKQQSTVWVFQDESNPTRVALA